MGRKKVQEDGVVAGAPPGAVDSVEEVLGAEPDEPTEEELARALAMIRRSKKVKPKDRCPGDGCGKKLQSGESYCWNCAAKKVMCVRCAAGLQTIGEFLCPLCIADGEVHCILCLRPRGHAGPMCPVCEKDAQAANLAGSTVAVDMPAATEADFAAMEAASQPPLRPAV